MLLTEEKAQEVTVGDEDSQIVIRALEEITLSSLKKYLSSPIFHNIGPVISRRIVSFFGIRTTQVIESAKELMKVKGIGPKRILAIQNGWTFQKRLTETAAELIRLKSVQ